MKIKVLKSFHFSLSPLHILKQMNPKAAMRTRPTAAMTGTVTLSGSSDEHKNKNGTTKENVSYSLITGLSL